MQASNSFGQLYKNDLLKLLKEVVNEYFEGDRISILEIGCGGGLILKELAVLGHDIMGCDPSPIAIQNASENNLPHSATFYPGDLEGIKFDLIFHADVLEHIEDPIAFLTTQLQHLAAEGVLVISVPDCTESIELGDVSMALHQHINYFSENSLQTVIERAGFGSASITTAGYGGSLYAVAKKGGESNFSSGHKKYSLYSNETDFIAKAEKALDKISTLMAADTDHVHSTGLYVPLRAFPYLGQLNAFTNGSFSYRIFDDTPSLHGMFFDGVDTAIENQAEFLKNPSDRLFVMSLTFGELIKNNIRSLAPAQSEIFCLRDILLATLAES